MKKLYMFFLLILLVSCLAAADPLAIHVSVDTTMAFQTQISIGNAKQMLLESTRRNALISVLPSTVSYYSLYQDMYIARDANFDDANAEYLFTKSAMGGLFEKEKKVFESPLIYGDTFNLRLHYEADIRLRNAEPNPSIKLDMTASNLTPIEGQSYKVRVKTSVPGYVYLFDFLDNGTAILIFPTFQDRGNFFNQGQAKEFTISIISNPKNNMPQSVESVYAVYSPTPLDGWQRFQVRPDPLNIVFPVGEESFQLFQMWLNRLNPNNYDQKMVQIHFVEKAEQARK